MINFNSLQSLRVDLTHFDTKVKKTLKHMLYVLRFEEHRS